MKPIPASQKGERKKNVKKHQKRNYSTRKLNKVFHNIIILFCHAKKFSSFVIALKIQLSSIFYYNFFSNYIILFFVYSHREKYMCVFNFSKEKKNQLVFFNQTNTLEIINIITLKQFSINIKAASLLLHVGK